MTETSTIRVFISSPGDVFEERTLAQRVIERVQAEFAGRVLVEPVFWEHEPLLATDSFQTQISKPSDADVMVAILWSRLGTRLPQAFTRADGSRYESGTEFEFENAVQAFRETGKPQLLVYRKTAKTSVHLDDEAALLNRIDQKRKLDRFIANWFHDTEDGSLKAAFHPFESPSDFEQVLERHLRKIVMRALPELGGREAAATAVWKKGSPFRGLQTFDYEHAPVFFGRTRAIADVLESLRRQAAAGRAFVMILGMSGGGKSSLARAGVLPMLSQPGVIEGVGLWRRAIFRPSDVRGDLFLGLATALLREPGIRLEGTSPEELAGVLRSSPSAAVTLIRSALARDAAELAGRTPDHRPPEARLALLVDQMEEIFTQDWVEPQDRAQFIDTIDTLARSGRVWVVTTFRADLYPRCASIPALVALKEGAGQYDLMPPTATEIGQMVRLPTRAAGLRFEEDFATNERLDDMLRDAAAVRPELLPLLQFTLEELYQRRREDGVLTLAAYSELGGVEGSLARRAETVYEQLPEDVQAALPRVLNVLVHMRREGQEAIGRRRASHEDFDTPEARQLLEAFVAARLFVSELDDAGRAAVMITHEALLRHWPRARDWVEQNRENLRIQSRISAATERWIKEDRSYDLLLPAGKPLDEGKGLLESGASLSAVEAEFVRESMAAARARQNIKRGVVAALAVLALVTSATAFFANNQRQRADAERARAEVEAETARRTSDFVVGLFEVSDPSEARGKEITAAEILRAGAARIDRELVSEPEIQARLMETLGKVYTSLGALDDAEPMLRLSLDRRRRLPNASGGDIASSLNHLGFVLALKANFDEAEQAYQEALDTRREVFGPAHPHVAETLTGLAYVKGLRGDYASAESLLREALEIRRESLGGQHLAVAETLEELGMNQFDQGDYPQAQALLEEALAMRRTLLGSDPHPKVAENLNNLALVVYKQGDPEKAESLFRNALTMKRALLPEANNEIAIGMNNLATLLRDRGDFEAAEDTFREALEIQRQVLGETHTEIAVTMLNLGLALDDAGRTAEAVELGRASLQIRRERYGPEHTAVANGMMTLAQWLADTGAIEEAETLLRDALAMRERLLGAEHPDVALSRLALANQLADDGRIDQACEVSDGTVRVLDDALGTDHWRVAVARGLEGACLLAKGRLEDAEASLLRSLERLEAETGARADLKRQTLRRLIQLYEEWNRAGDVQKYQRLLSQAASR